MTFLRRAFLALTILTAAGSIGCVQIGVAVLSGVLKAALTPSGGGGRSGMGGLAGSELGTPVDGSVDRAMSACELERGRWREAHQDQDEPPPGLRCTADGAYPKVPPALATQPAAMAARPPVIATQPPASAAQPAEPAPAPPPALGPEAIYLTK